MSIQALPAIAMLLALVSLSSTSYGQPVLKFGHTLSSESPWGQGAAQFADLVNKQSGGRIRISVYAAGSLGNASDLLHAAQIGTIDFALVPISLLGEKNVDFRVFDALFLFEDLGPVVRFQKSDAGRTLLQRGATGVRGLSYWHSSMRWIAGKREFSVPEALKGSKIAEPSSAIASQLASLGAVPVRLPAADLFSALQQGAVDAVDATPFGILDLKLNETARVVTLTNHSYVGYVLVVSDKAWNAIPAELRSSVERASVEAATKSNEMVIEIASNSLQALRRGGVKVELLTGAQRTQWIQASRKQWTDVAPSKYVDYAMTFATGGGGDYCVIPECRCSDRSCSKECCK